MEKEVSFLLDHNHGLVIFRSHDVKSVSKTHRRNDVLDCQA